MADETLREAVLALVRRAAAYPLRWTDEKTSRGDFDGRDSAIEIFDVSASEQRAVRRRLRGVCKMAQSILGTPLVLIFHTPEATATYYQDLLVGLSRIDNAILNTSLTFSVHGRLSNRFTVSISPALDMPLTEAA
jgi:hypothetical protein